jgi:hypothetical protein
VLGKIIKIVSFLVGLLFAGLGLFVFFTLASGAVVAGSRDALVTGICFVLVALPFLVFPFSLRLAKLLGVLVLLVLAAAALWLMFSPNLAAAHPAIYQAATIALGVLLVARVGLALLRRRRLGT